MTTLIRNEILHEIEQDLHDLCQPLTSLQCRLELAQMIGDPESLKEAVALGLEDTRRLFAGVAAMRERLLHKDGNGEA